MLILDGLSEKTVLSLRISPEVIRSYPNIFALIKKKIGATNEEKIQSRIRDTLLRASVMQQSTVPEVFQEKPIISCVYLQYGQFCFKLEQHDNEIILVSIATGENKKITDKKNENKSYSRNQQKGKSAIDITKIQFTAHAIDQFKKRFQAMHNIELPNPTEKALSLLLNASEKGAITPVGRIKRLIDNKFVEVRYFVTPDKRWRFIIRELKDGTYSVFTIEYVLIR